VPGGDQCRGVVDAPGSERDLVSHGPRRRHCRGHR
jgi:hypothetical protein